MNLKSLIAAWDEDRVQTVGKLIEFLKGQGFDLQKIQSAFKKAGFNIHVHEEREDNSNVAQDQNPKIKKEDEWFSQGLNDSLKDNDDFDEILSKLTVKDIPIGTQIDHMGKIYTWKGASWVSGGTLAKKEVGASLTHDALTQIAKKKQNEPQIKSTVPGLEVGTMLTGPDNKIYTWKGASWVSSGKFAKKEISQELTKQALSNIQKEQPEIETANQNPETTSGPEKINDVSPKVKELSQILLKHAPNAAELLKMNTPLTRLALAILCSPHYQQILDALQKS